MSEGLDIRYYLFVARRRILYFLLPMLAALVLGSAIILSLPKIYNSSAKILVESPEVVLDVKTTASSAVQRIQSLKQKILGRESLLRMADRFQLYAKRKDLSRTDVVNLMLERTTFEMVELVNPSAAGRRSSEKPVIVLAVGFDDENPKNAQEVANEIMNMVLEEDSRERKSDAKSTLDFVEREVQQLQRDLFDLDEKISTFKVSNSHMLPEKLSFNMQVLEKQQDDIATIKREQVALQNQKKVLEIELLALRARGPTTPNTEGNGAAGGGNITTLEQKLAVLQSEYTTLLATFSAQHPNMRKLQGQIRAVQAEVDALKKSLANPGPIDSSDPNISVDERLTIQKIEMVVQQAQLNEKRLAELEGSVVSLRSIIDKTPDIGAQLQAIERTRASTQANLEVASAKLLDAERQMRQEDEQVAEKFSPVELPVLPVEPVRPKRNQLLLMALIGSLGLGGATAFGTEYLDSTVRRGKDITNKLNSRLIVTIPYIKTRAEVRKTRGTAGLYVLGLIALTAGLLLLVHLFYERLDVLFFSAMNSLGL